MARRIFCFHQRKKAKGAFIMILNPFYVYFYYFRKGCPQA